MVVSETKTAKKKKKKQLTVILNGHWGIYIYFHVYMQQYIAHHHRLPIFTAQTTAESTL